MSVHTNNDSLMQDIENVVQNHLENGGQAEDITKEIFRKLDQHKLLFYQDEKRISLLNSHGRTLMAIMEDPSITQRALSVYLNVSESNINKSLRLLLADGIITKTRVKGRNRYEFNIENGLKHPDIFRIAQLLLPLYGTQATQQTLHHSSE